MWKSGAARLIGGRENQEDCWSFVQQECEVRGQRRSLCDRPDTRTITTVVLCDGMGGHDYGAETAKAVADFLTSEPTMVYEGVLPPPDALHTMEWPPRVYYNDVKTPAGGGTTVMAFTSDGVRAGIGSCGDTHGIVWAVNDDGSLAFHSIAHNSSIGVYGNILKESWPNNNHSGRARYAFPLTIDVTFKLDKRYLVLLATDGIDCLMPELRKAQIERALANNEFSTSGLVPDQSFVDLIGTDFSDLESLAAKIANTAVQKSGEDADNTTVILLLWEPENG